MIHKHTVKFRPTDDYAVVWRLPVPLVKITSICPRQQLHPLLGPSSQPLMSGSRRQRMSLMFRHALCSRYDPFLVAFDASVNDYWQRQHSEAFALDLMEEGAF